MMRSVTIRELVNGDGGDDEAIVTAFLAARPNTTMFLRSNLARAGLGYSGATYQGVYVGAFEDDAESQRLVGIIAHYWNDNVVLAAGKHAAALTSAVIAASKRPVKGFLGPYEEVIEARRAAAPTATATPTTTTMPAVAYESKEILFALDLAELVIPPALSSGAVSARAPRDSELPMLLEWRMGYAAETMHTPDTPEKREQQKKYLAMLHKDGHGCLLFLPGERSAVAYSAFNAALPDTVQVGGVWTPLHLRGRGYARCVVAASLAAARARGVARAILFTSEDNIAAQRCYTSLGFRAVGDYALVFFS